MNQHKNEPWYDYLLNNNPYNTWKNETFAPNLWQQLLESFGDDSARAKYEGDLKMRSNEWISNFVEQMRQQDWNNPSNQAMLERGAGLNPDLTGISGVGSASENDQPNFGELPSMSHEQAQQQIGAFANMCMQAYSFASGIAKDTLSLQSAWTDIQGKQLENDSKIPSLVDDFIKNVADLPHYDSETGKYDFTSFRDYMNQAEQYASSHFHSHRVRKSFLDSVGRGLTSAKGYLTRYGVMKDSEDTLQGFYDSIGRGLAYGRDYDDFDNNPMIMISKELHSAQLKVERASKYEKYNSSAYHGDYYGKLDSDLASNAFNDSNKQVSESYEASKGSRKIDKILNDTLEHIISNLSRSANSKGLEGALSQGFLLFFSAMRSNMIPKLPSM